MSPLYPYSVDSITDSFKSLSLITDKAKSNAKSINMALPSCELPIDSFELACAFVDKVFQDQEQSLPLRTKDLPNTVLIDKEKRVFISLHKPLGFSGAQGLKFKSALMVTLSAEGVFERVEEVVKIVLPKTELAFRRISCMQMLKQSAYFPVNYGFYSVGEKLSVYQELASRDLLQIYTKHGLYGLSAFKKQAVFKALLGACSDLEAAGLVHCDLKLDNVLVFDDGHVKVSDLGYARRLDDPVLQREVNGSLHIFAPDIVRRIFLNGKDTQYTYADDVWSVALILHTLCQEELPIFELCLYELNEKPEGAKKQEILAKWSTAIKELPKAPEKLTSLNDIVVAMLQEARENRLTTAKALIAVLDC